MEFATLTTTMPGMSTAPTAPTMNGHLSPLAASVPAVALTQVPVAAPPPGGGVPRSSARPVPPARAAAGRRPRWTANLHGTATIGKVFYAAVLLSTLTGGAQAAASWLDWPIWGDFVLVATIELGGVYLSQMADERRQLNETAIAARVLSAMVAVGAVCLNWFGHVHLGQPIQAGVFAGLSALGYSIWIIQSGQRRRDALRAAGKLAVPPPSYGLVQWLGHPIITAKARSLAKDNPGMGRVDSLEAVRVTKALGRLIHTRVEQSNGKGHADAILAVFDPTVMGGHVRGRMADQWAVFADLIVAEIDPRKVLAPPAPALPVKATRQARPARTAQAPRLTEPVREARLHNPGHDRVREVEVAPTARISRTAEQSWAEITKHLEQVNPNASKAELARVLEMSRTRVGQIFDQFAPKPSPAE